MKKPGNTDNGIVFGGDQIAPLVGLALNNDSGWSLIPLIQHFVSYNGADINMTATWAVSAPRHSNVPHFEGPACLVIEGSPAIMR